MNSVASIEKNLCPYPVPTVKDIIKRIESAIYRIGKYQLITDVLECGAISIANTVDLTERTNREEQYKKVMEKYQPEEQKILSEVFTMIYQLLSSVVYDDGCFDDYLGELFMRCEQGNSGTAVKESGIEGIWCILLLWQHRVASIGSLEVSTASCKGKRC